MTPAFAQERFLAQLGLLASQEKSLWSSSTFQADLLLSSHQLELVTILWYAESTQEPSATPLPSLQLASSSHKGASLPE